MPLRTPTRRVPDSGVTLIEMLVTLVLFAAIGVAGFTLLDQSIRSRTSTEGRLERLGEIQRALFALRIDLATTTLKSDALNANFENQSNDQILIAKASGRTNIAVDDDRLVRSSELRGLRVNQVLISKVSNMDVTYFYPSEGWREEVVLDVLPRAVSLSILLSDAEGSVQLILPLMGDGIFQASSPSL